MTFRKETTISIKTRIATDQLITYRIGVIAIDQISIVINRSGPISGRVQFHEPRRSQILIRGIFRFDPLAQPIRIWITDQHFLFLLTLFKVRFVTEIQHQNTRFCLGIFGKRSIFSRPLTFHALEFVYESTRISSRVIVSKT